MENVEWIIYLAKDSHGNKTYAVCEDSSSSVQICGMRNKLGSSVYFESEAYHLSTWCRDNEIELKVINRSEKFSDLFETSEKREPWHEGVEEQKRLERMLD